jgi:hypothetical protein
MNADYPGYFPFIVFVLPDNYKLSGLGRAVMGSWLLWNL